MWKKLLNRLAQDLIENAYVEGYLEGVQFAKSHPELYKNTGKFKKGNIPWNKGKKKGENDGK